MLNYESTGQLCIFSVIVLDHPYTSELKYLAKIFTWVKDSISDVATVIGTGRLHW